MLYTKIVCAMALILFFSASCSSNQSSDINHQKNINSHFELPSISKDGRLRAEHVHMYVSAKIKQEQLRYEKESHQKNIEFTGSLNNSNSSENISLERAAIEHFEFDPQVYFWSKNIIDDTLANYTDNDSNPRKSMSNIGNPVIAHNLRILKKFKDDLRFARYYKLKPKLLTTSSSALKRKPST